MWPTGRIRSRPSLRWFGNLSLPDTVFDMQLRIRQFYTFIEHKLSESGKDSEIPLRKIAVVAVVENPYAGQYVEDLQPLIDASVSLGAELSKLAIQALAPYKAESYGKAGIVGINGEQE